MDAALRARLETAYRATTYAAGLSLRLRVGQPHPFLDDMMAFRGLEAYAYLTAWNPGSKELPEAENRARQDDLRARLKGRHPVIEGVASADDGSWREDGLLVLGIPRDDALSLARDFGQVAILAGRRGGAPELAWVE
jgi:hypothetical protein